jgi:arginase family enzyme
MEKKITFLGVSSGICAPTAKGQIGAELAFDAIRAHALISPKPTRPGELDRRKIFIDNETEKVVTIKDLYDYIDEMDNSDIFFQDLEKQPDDPLKNDRFARHIGYLDDIFKKIKSKVYEALWYNEFPFIIAGDHSTSAATIRWYSPLPGQIRSH